MRKNEGIITIEATISLTAFLFCILFFLNFAKVYMAQNMVAYGAMEAGKQYSIAYYKAAAIGSSEIGGLVAEILGIWADGEDSGEGGSDDLGAGDILMLTSGSSSARVEEYFARSISGNLSNAKAAADQRLKAVGIADGMDGLDFSGTKLLNSQNKIEIQINYKIKLIFPFFGIEEIEMEERAANRLWKFTKWS